MRTRLLLWIIILYTGVLSAQRPTFAQSVPENFTSVSLQLDLFGSLDKEGINTVVSFSGVDHGWLEYELQFQTLFNEWRSNVGMVLYYADIQFGLGYYIQVGEIGSITPGAHVGMMFRPKELIDPTYDGYMGGLIFGPTLKGRIFMGKSKRWCFTVSSAYDYRWDLVKYGDYFRINGRAGIEILF